MLENYVAVSNKVKHTHTLDPEIPFMDIYPRKMKTCLHTQKIIQECISQSLLYKGDQ